MTAGGSRLETGFAAWQGDPFLISSFPFQFTEADLSRLWQDQTFPPQALVSGDGEKLRVIYRGRRGGGTGPDFRDALIAAPRGLLRGDVELHVRSSDFRRHGHHLDPAYAGVVLHLVFRDDEGRPTPLSGGGCAPVAALADWVQGRAAEIVRWLERPALWREPCFSALGRQGPPTVAATLDRLGDMRFRRKTAATAARLREIGGGQSEIGTVAAEADELLWQGLLEALAYGGARETFRLLALRLPWSRLRERLSPLPASVRAVEAQRLLGEAAAGLPGLPSAACRPGNSAERRLKGAAALAARLAPKGLLAEFAELLDATPAGEAEDGARNSKGETRKRRGATRAGVSSFGSGAAQRMIDALTVRGLIGRGRAVEIAANAVLPCLAALGPEPSARRAESAFAALPLPARYGAVRHLHEAVGGAVPVNSRRQQGMLYLLKQYCTQGGCGVCPLS